MTEQRSVPWPGTFRDVPFGRAVLDVARRLAVVVPDHGEVAHHGRRPEVDQQHLDERVTSQAIEWSRHSGHRRDVTAGGGHVAAGEEVTYSG